MSNTTSVHACLAAIGLSVQDLCVCTNLTEEFTLIKRAYFKKVLVVHPDKGGNPEEFRNVNTSFELIRSLFEKQAVSSFVNAAETSRARYHDSDAASQSAQQPWQYYYDAAAAEEPPYKVELARSGRSKCVQRTKSAKRCPPNDPIIDKGEIRIGSIDAFSGSYGRWVHLACWRVPSRIWLGLPADSSGRDSVAEFEAALAAMNEVQFCGFNELAPHQKRLIVLHVMEKRNWAKQVNVKGRAVAISSSNNSAPSVKTQSQARGAGDTRDDPMPSSSSTAVSTTGGNRGYFVVPRPGVNGAQPDFLRNKTIVMTGLFPEIGGGSGLNLGKDRLKKMCETFGARVTSAVSGKTDLLIVGREPGQSKVAKAGGMPKCQLISLPDLALSIEGKQQLTLAPPPEIEVFSTGYNGSVLAALSDEAGFPFTEIPTFQATRAPKSAKKSTRTKRPKQTAKKSTGARRPTPTAKKSTGAKRATQTPKKSTGAKRATKASTGKAKRAKFS